MQLTVTADREAGINANQEEIYSSNRLQSFSVQESFTKLYKPLAQSRNRQSLQINDYLSNQESGIIEKSLILMNRQENDSLWFACVAFCNLAFICILKICTHINYECFWIVSLILVMHIRFVILEGYE